MAGPVTRGSLEDVIMDELNVKAVEYADDMGLYLQGKAQV